MKIKYLKLKNWLLFSAMSLLGLSACHSQKDVVKSNGGQGDEPAGYNEHQYIAMYGVPTRAMRVQPDDNDAPKDKPMVQAREPQVTVYGVPTVDFAVKGRVVNSKGKPVKGVVVTLINSDIDPDNLPDTPHWKEQMARMSDTTDAEGAFAVRTTDRPWEKVRVMVRDVDGKQNGLYENQLLDVQFGDPEPGNKPVSSWQLGEKKAEVTIQMDEKK